MSNDYQDDHQTDSNGTLTVIQESSPYGDMALAPTASVGTQIQLMSAMVDRRISTAMAFPRKVSVFKMQAAELIKADKETAQKCEYAKPMFADGKKQFIVGPSVRLAEIAALCWRNIEVEVFDPVVSDKSVTVKASAWDLEKNYRQEAVVSTPIVKKDGKRYPQHMIDTMILATASKAKRNAILAVIPRVYINQLLDIARKVASGDEKSLEVRRKDMVAWFASKHGVAEKAVLGIVDVQGMDDLGEEHLSTLRLIANAIRDGEGKVEDYFGTEAERAPVAPGRHKIGNGKQPKAEQTKSQPAEPPGGNPGEVSPQPLPQAEPVGSLNQEEIDDLWHCLNDATQLELAATVEHARSLLHRINRTPQRSRIEAKIKEVEARK